MYHKAKIVCFSILMWSIGTTYTSYFNNLSYRSGIFQQKALAAEAGYEFTDFRNPLDPRTLDKLEHNYFQPSDQWLQDWGEAMTIAKHRERILAWSEAQWSEWETMHENVVWFDTAGCLDGGFIGEVNKHKGGPNTSLTIDTYFQTFTGEKAEENFTEWTESLALPYTSTFWS